MQHSTNPEQREPFTSQSGAETENSKNSPLMIREQIPNTPFYIVGTQETGYWITWGKFRFNEELIPDDPALDLADIAQEWILNHQWEITLHLIAIAMAANENAKK